MSMRTPARPGRLLGFVLVLALGWLASLPARGDLIFLKDGFVLEGQVKRESVAEFDKASGEMIIIPKGFSFYVDDSPRRIYFGHTMVGDTKARDRAEEIRLINKNVPMILQARPLPALESVLETGDWNDKWERSFRFSCPQGAVPLIQRMGFLTPYFARADGTSRFAWSAFYLTRELGPEAVAGLLRTHPDFKDSPDLKPEDRVTRRFKFCDFLAQAGWYPQADAEFNRLAKDMPELKDKVEASLAVLSRLRARDQFEEIKRLHQAGQVESVGERLEAFPEKSADDKVLAQLTELRSEQAANRDKLAQARRYLEELADKVEGGNRKAFVDMAAAIKTELCPESLPRLESFLGQAAQAERLRKDNQPAPSPAELLSLAVTGSLLGNPSAENNVDRALRVWAARNLVLAYMKEPAADKRQKLLADYSSGKDQVPLDEFVHMIPLLPPVAPDEKIDPKPTEVRLGGQGIGAVTYLLQVPPEYRPGRAYPVLFVLHNGGEKASVMLERWRKLAAENGYFLVAPSWEQGINGGYGYSEREHSTVLLALRDLRQRFNIDSDRVFLFGLGQGANMAYDIGLSHPDLFAGVIPMSGNPELFTVRYFRNAQYLPFYVILGDHAGDPNKRTRDLFTIWLQRGYPTMWVQYKGRGMEWFGGEPVNIMDWMRTKKRAFPMQQLGNTGNGGTFGNEFSTMRQIDNHFYWLSTSSILERCLNSASGWNERINSAMLTARIDSPTNEIVVRASGVRQVTVWLGRNGRGDSMIDFDKPVSVRMDLATVWAHKPITPRLATLLEYVYQTGDRQRMYLAKLDLAYVGAGWRAVDR